MGVTLSGSSPGVTVRLQYIYGLLFTSTVTWWRFYCVAVF